MKSRKSWYSVGREECRQQGPEKAAGKNHSSLVEFRDDALDRDGVGVDVEKGRRDRRKEHDHQRRAGEAHRGHEIHHHAVRRLGARGERGAESDGIHPRSGQQVAPPRAPETPARVQRKPRIIRDQRQPGNRHRDDKVQPLHERHGACRLDAQKGGDAVVLQDGVRHHRGKRDEKKNGDALEPFPEAVTGQCPSRGQHSGDDNPRFRPEPAALRRQAAPPRARRSTA